MSDYINQITATDGTTYDIKDTISGYTTNTGTVTGMTTTAGTHTAGAQTVSSGIITTNIPTNTSHLTNDSGFITSYTDEKLKVSANTGSGTFYPVLTTTTTTAENKKYDTLFTCVRASGVDAHIGIGINGTAKGSLRLYTTTTGKYGIITPGTLTDTRTYTLPDATGTIALTSDLSNFITDAGVTKITTTAGAHTAITNATGAVSFNVPTTAAHVNAVATSDKYTRTSAGGLDWINQTDGDAKVIAKSALAYWNGSYNGTNSNLSICSAGTIIGSNNVSTSGEFGKIPQIKSDGVLEVGKYIDFHNTSGTGDNNSRLTVSDAGNLSISGGSTDGSAARIVNTKFGSSAPSGSAPTGTVYFQTGSSAYTFVDRVNITGKSCTTSGLQLTSISLSAGVYLIAFQFNCGTISSGTVRCDVKAGSNTIIQVRGASGQILGGAALVQCTSTTSVTFTGVTSTGTSSNSEIHYSYVKLF